MNAEGVRLFEQARYDEAIHQFHESVNNDPKNPDGYYNLARAHHHLGKLNQDESNLNQAKHYYDMCRYHDPSHPECHRGLAVLLVEQGKSEEAFRLLEDWARREPILAEPRIELARLYEEFGDRQTAIEHLRSAVTIDHRNARAFAALGRLQEQMGDTVQALKDYERAHQYDPRQEDVAARIAALRSRQLPGTPGSAYPPSADDTRVVQGSANPAR
jgi:tetratricopeptide (TPR) repeat protein